MNKLFKDEAIALVTYENNTFKVNPEALEILKQVEAPISILGVAGLYRSGKSFLLNRIILNQERGFNTGSTVNACTRGIWMWGRPLKAQTDDNQIVNLIVLDSEGFGALDQDSSHDCRIFALILLLSSIFLYNSMGPIDENAIANLSVVINLTKHLKVKAGVSKNYSRATGETSMLDGKLKRLAINGPISDETINGSKKRRFYRRIRSIFSSICLDFA